MAENKKKNSPVKEEVEEQVSFIPYLAERLFGTVEDFVKRLTNIAADRAGHFVNHSVQKFGLLIFFSVGAIFLFMGSAKVIDGLIGFPGIGQMIVGTLILLVAGIALLFIRQRVP